MTEDINSSIQKKFKIYHELGRGAYGIVWKANDHKTGEDVAIKKIVGAFQNTIDAQIIPRNYVFTRNK